MTTGDTAPIHTQIEVFDYPDLDLRTLQPSEIVDLDRVLKHYNVHRIPADDKEARDPALIYSYEERAYLSLGLDLTLCRLPKRDLDFARAVYTAFAISPLAEDRKAGAQKIGFLTRTDHDYGLSLWDQLVRDLEADVRSSAISPVQYFREGVRKRNQTLIAQMRDETGLTPREAARLVRTYEAAERGEKICDLGELALRRLTGGHPLRRHRVPGSLFTD